MKYALLVKKIALNKEKFLTREELRDYSKTLKISYESAIRYLISNNYLVRIMRGVFYILSVEEKKLKKIDISYFDAIKKALKIKKVKNWYFGLETALKLNNVTHEHFTETTVISDKIYRAKPFKIIGHSTRFIKIKRNLLKFGIMKKRAIHSDIEKTLLDMIYFGRYNNLTEFEIKNKISGYVKYCSKAKLIEYSMYYPKTVKKIIDELL